MMISGLNFRHRGGSVVACAVALLLTACAPGQDTPTPTTGVDLTRYVAVGDSYTAGLSAGGLTRLGQEYSFPNLLAKQFQSITSNAGFTQPLLEAGSGSGYFNLADFTTTGYARTRRVAGQAVRGSVINPSACGGPDTLRLLTRSATAAALPQNLGVPGLLLSQIETAGLGNEANARPGIAFNPYFERLLPAADSRTYLQTVTTAVSSATFFTFFQGLDDFLPYVRSGGTCGTVPGSLTFGNLLRNNADKLLAVLAAGGRPGIIARLPSITALPLVGLGKGNVVEARLQASFGDTARIYFEDPFGGAAARHITDSDYILATALPRVGQLTAVTVGGSVRMLPYGRHALNPLRNADVLENATEMVRITGAINSYNNALNDLALKYKVAIVDPNSGSRTVSLDDVLFNQVAGVIFVNGVQYSSEPVRGNFYSLDYYTLTPRGNGLLANAFITAINRAYKANIPAIDVNKLPATAQ
ncbi:hypothetical protein [Hymenobacter rubidus]|uniref:hypothetical protein n=1 Tax=Hymenobacter rubidus TaxID=1441626 RepID=UPI00191C9B2F|nr:hypothetical protein [Hymenobacter rubidus]